MGKHGRKTSKIKERELAYNDFMNLDTKNYKPNSFDFKVQSIGIY